MTIHSLILPTRECKSAYFCFLVALFKEQRLVVIGSKGMITFEDSADEKEIRFYNKQIKFEEGVPIKVENPTEIISFEQKQPLREELTYFVEHLDKKIIKADGKSGYDVVKVLERAQQIIDDNNK